MVTMERAWPLLILLLLLPDETCSNQYEELAAMFGTTTEEVLTLGGIPDTDCTFAFNATKENCDALIAAYEEENPGAGDCGCYNFCNGKNQGCYDVGTFPPFFTCDLNQVVAGCQKGAESKFSPLSASEGDVPCPRGYMCSKDKEKPCEEVRRIPVALGLGDVHAGIYCPGGSHRKETGVRMCESGSYCPNSTTMLPCPAGYFCPHKTAKPEIICGHCPEGARTLQRQPYGYIAAAVIAGLLALIFVYSMFKRYNVETYEKLRELRGRNLDKVRAKIQRTKRQEKLKALQPKLEVIENRLRQNASKIQADPTVSGRALNTQTESGKIKFDARKMFDLMDTNGDGELSFEEINVALDLNPIQLREFARRMNQAAKVPPETETIARDVFINFFLRVLEQTSHFEPTPIEANQLFDEILDANGTADLDGITHESLFDSPLADFLAEKQINQLIKRFRSLQEKHMATTLEEADTANPRNGTEFDLIPPPKPTKRSSFNWGGPRPAGGADSVPKARRRRSTSMTARQIRRASLTRDSGDGETHRNPFKFKRPSILTFMQKFDTISREEFIAWYPALLMEITAQEQEENAARLNENLGGVDIAFENLSLTVTVKDNKVKIVDKVSGRIRAGTMTALMGGSGAGKTSLLNALCGRAFYGEVTGTVKVNGHKTSIEEHSSAVGFVPQDDIVYAELTVRENFVFSGKFQLPKGTPMQEIEDLADETMASLGLSRVMHSIVGDVTRRGVSGGEKKRVNIGLELMARPRILFLDEPTSGLDANSALMVMESLQTLVSSQGTTVCSVIHQPRKFIYELFDSIILLGVGGKMVYHGPTEEAEAYFTKLHYVLPPGESIADWLIDISSGRLGPTKKDDTRFRPLLDVTIEEDSKAIDLSESSDVPRKSTDDVLPVPVPEPVMPAREGSVHSFVSGASEAGGSDHGGSESMIQSMQDLVRSTLGDGAADVVEDEAGKAKARREVLYDKWRHHFKNLSEEQKEQYTAPEPYDLPAKVEKAVFRKQLLYQLQRCAIVGERNWSTKVIDTAIILGAVLLVSGLDGTEQPTVWQSYGDLNYDKVAEPSTVVELLMEFPKLFMYAIQANLSHLQGYAVKLGVLVSVLIALAAGKAITAKRKEFFRESASGYDVNAYFGAVNIVGTIEHSLQAILCTICAIWLRNSLASWYSWLVSFLLMSWISVSWAYLIPLVVPLDSVVMCTGFYMVVFSLLFSGNIAPVLYKNLYANNGMAIFSGLFSPTRWFIETLAVVESRCLPVQSGFTDFGVNFVDDATQVASYVILGLGMQDLGTITQMSFDGWYWGALPAFVIGCWVRWISFGLIHISDRAKQAKKPLRQILDVQLAVILFVYFMVLGGLTLSSIYLILRESSSLP